MKKLEIKDTTRLLRFEDGETGHGPSILINHWDLGPFATGGLTYVPLNVSEVKRVHKFMDTWLKNQTKKKKVQK